MPESARYAYAVSRGVDEAALAAVLGLLEQPLGVVRHRGLDAVVSDVPLEEFGEDALKQNLESLPWLEKVARAHHEVVDAVAALGATAPMRMATIFLDDDGVRQRLEEWHSALEEVLDRVEHRAEWSVKVIAAVAETTEPVTAEPTSGTEFLRRRRTQVSTNEDRLAELGRIAEAVHVDLSEVAVATRILAPQDPQLTGHTGTMALNGAYLVAEEDHARFAARVADLVERLDQVHIESAGPWPPYSFAALEPS